MSSDFSVTYFPDRSPDAIPQGQDPGGIGASYEVRLGAGGYAIRRLVSLVPCRVQMVIQVLHGGPKLAVVVLGAGLDGADSPPEFLCGLAQME
jgi:hypothetical protein